MKVAGSQDAQLGTYAQSWAGTQGPQQLPFAELTMPGSHSGVGNMHVTPAGSQLKPTLQRPALHWGLEVPSTPIAAQAVAKQVLMLHGGGDSPGASATQWQQSECSVHSLA